MKTQNRFSFVEFLILFLIVGTVGSIASPLLQRLRDDADLAKCRGNLYLLGAAAHLYASENKGVLPGTLSHSASEYGTYVADGRMYGKLLPSESGGGGEPGHRSDYLGSPHPLICPSLSPEVYASGLGYKRPEEITLANPIIRMGYVYLHHSQRFRSVKPNDTMDASPHAPLCIDFGWSNSGGQIGETIAHPSHPDVMNVLHLEGHVTTFSLEEANQISGWSSLFDALLQNSSSR